MKRLFNLILLVAMGATAALAQHSDWGLSASVGADYKINKRWGVGVETEYRSRNDFRTTDQWSIAMEGAYKPLKWLKLSAGYQFKYYNCMEKINYHADGTLNNWRPSYYSGAHRGYISATGSLSVQRFSFSLRERFQHTYRPGTTQPRYDFDDKAWSDKVIAAKSKSMLRSRVKIDYNIPKSKVDPYVSVELFNAMRIDKVRYTAGVEWKLRKAHVFNLFYRYQKSYTATPEDDNDIDENLIGVGYTFKF